jgi:hypothetical protein
MLKTNCYICENQVEPIELGVGQYPVCDKCTGEMENEKVYYLFSE